MKLRVIAVASLAALASQAGHLIAYQLRFGAAAQAVQSSGAHAYFPGLAKTGLGLAATAVLGALLVTGFARLATGRRLEAEAPPSYVRMLAALFTLQLAIYAAQETLEARLAGSALGSAADLLLWGAIGQLPAAAAAALALRRLLARLGPAVEAILVAVTATVQPVAPALAPVAVALPIDAPAFGIRIAATSLTRRGPPSFVR